MYLDRCGLHAYLIKFPFSMKKILIYRETDKAPVPQLDTIAGIVLLFNVLICKRLGNVLINYEVDTMNARRVINL